MKRIAITGGIAEGKSTVLSYLADCGFVIESADRIARTVFQSNAVQDALANLLALNPPIPADMLRERLLDDSVRRQVNSVTHPLILKSLRLTAAEFVEVPLLIETCLQGEFDGVWVVTCGPEEQLRRLSARLGSGAAAEAMIGTQLTSRTKIPFGDRLIRTNQDESSVKRCVTSAAQRDL